MHRPRSSPKSPACASLHADATVFWPQSYDKMSQQMNALYKKHDCSPMKSVIAMIIQAPVMISVFLSLRHMADHYPSFKDGGMYWFTV